MTSVGIFEVKTHLASLLDDVERGSKVSDMPIRDLQYLKLAKAYHLPLAANDALMREAALQTGLLVLPELS